MKNSTRTSRKLWHIFKYLMNRLAEESPACLDPAERWRWIAINYAATIVSKLRDEELGWSE